MPAPRARSGTARKRELERDLPKIWIDVPKVVTGQIEAFDAQWFAGVQKLAAMKDTQLGVAFGAVQTIAAMMLYGTEIHRPITLPRRKTAVIAVKYVPRLKSREARIEVKTVGVGDISPFSMEHGLKRFIEKYPSRGGGNLSPVSGRLLRSCRHIQETCSEKESITGFRDYVGFIPPPSEEIETSVSRPASKYLHYLRMGVQPGKIHPPRRGMSGPGTISPEGMDRLATWAAARGLVALRKNKAGELEEYTRKASPISRTQNPHKKRRVAGEGEFTISRRGRPPTKGPVPFEDIAWKLAAAFERRGIPATPYWSAWRNSQLPIIRADIRAMSLQVFAAFWPSIFGEFASIERYSERKYRAGEE